MRGNASRNMIWIWGAELTEAGQRRLSAEEPDRKPRRVRHPSYIGWMTLTIGSIIMLVAPGSWLAESEILRSTGGRVAVGIYTAFQAYVIAMLFPRMQREDDALKAQFGDEWVEWTKRTPYRLIPGIY
ncbi:hypothetical protein NUW54_g4519 [Trametes sanguinea]|uniref:Uncharacterized protein n=1 Tax=Trametes sanguinea TaxID=158606 RepID=A0ACC1PYY0_9APHY|nr:hypothetical protein NUW54_g4519 [Trametes sanguinea]